MNDERMKQVRTQVVGESGGTATWGIRLRLSGDAWTPVLFSTSDEEQSNTELDLLRRFARRAYLDGLHDAQAAVAALITP